MDETRALLEEDAALYSQPSFIRTRSQPTRNQRTSEDFIAAIETVDLSFRDISCEVDLPSGRFFSCAPAGKKRILSGVSGHAASGSFLAILGPSGSGKSSLIDILSGRKTVGDITGALFVNGTAVDHHSMKAISGYVSQDDVLLPTFTIRETFRFAADLRLPRSISDHDRALIVETTIQDLRLSHVADTRVGGAFVRGISGGEKRRVSIGVEILTSPSILFLDEPTSGLDANAALVITDVLKDLAVKKKTAVICCIHQPRSSIYEKFDQLMVLAEGRLVYAGERTRAEAYFEGLGYPCPHGWNAADFILDLVALQFERSRGASLSVDQLADHYAESDTHASLLASLPAKKSASINSSGDLVTHAFMKRGYAVGFFQQVSVLTRRNATHTARHPLLAAQQIAGYIFSGVLIGLLFSQLRESKFEQLTLGLSFMMDVFAVFSFFAVPTYIENRLNFNREQSAKYYSPLAYFIANFAILLPFASAVASLYMFIIYRLQGWNGSFGFALLVGVLCLQVFLALNELIGAALRSVDVALGIAGFLNLIAMVFSGYPNIPVYLRWLYWLTPMSYAQSAILLNEFGGYPEGEQYLDVFGSPLRHRQWDAVYALIGFLVLYRGLCYFALRYLQKEKR